MFQKLRKWFRVNCTEQRVLYRARSEARKVKICKNPDCKHKHYPQHTEFFGFLDKTAVFNCERCGSKVKAVWVHVVFEEIRILTFDVLSSKAIRWIDCYPVYWEKGNKEGEKEYGHLEMVYLDDVF